MPYVTVVSFDPLLATATIEFLDENTCEQTSTTLFEACMQLFRDTTFFLGTQRRMETLVEFRAGRMSRVDGKIVADPAKGSLRVWKVRQTAPGLQRTMHKCTLLPDLI
jgi:hypothetical protein